MMLFITKKGLTASCDLEVGEGDCVFIPSLQPERDMLEFKKLVRGKGLKFKLKVGVYDGIFGLLVLFWGS